MVIIVTMITMITIGLIPLFRLDNKENIHFNEALSLPLNKCYVKAHKHVTLKAVLPEG